MCVAMKYNSSATSCETFAYGEVENYAINLTNTAFAGFFIGMKITFKRNPFENYLKN